MSRSDKATIRSWWSQLSSDHFIALDPPTRNRYTQSDGHSDADELRDRTGRDRSTPYAFWHWQSHERAFDRSGAQVGPLYLHWGGDHQLVREALGEGPDGFEVADGGRTGAFVLDRVSILDADGLPDPGDEPSIRQFLESLSEPIDRRNPEFRYPALTESQRHWLHTQLAAAESLEQAIPLIKVLNMRSEVTAQEAEQWGRVWTGAEGDLTSTSDWYPLLVALLRNDDERGWAAVERIGSRALMAVGQAPSERGDQVLQAAAFAGSKEAISPWLATRVALQRGDLNDVTAALAQALADHGPSAEQWQELAIAFTYQSSQHWRDQGIEVAVPSIHRLTGSLDHRFPDSFREVLARTARTDSARVGEVVAGLPDDAELYPGYTAAAARVDLARFDEETAGLLRVSGPVLTGYEGGLVREWNNYRTLTDGDIEWLHAQVADPTTELQGLGFCLELLYAHGEGTTADVDALAPRWRKVLAKSYRTTYTEWRHPMVTLTCLAQELDHPLAGKLLAWWDKTPPAWKESTGLLTALGDPTQEKADALLRFVGEGGHDTGHLRTWAMTMAKVHGWDEPMFAIDALIMKDILGVHPQTLIPHLIALVDPAQPLWHYAINNTLAWWDRIVEAAEHPELSDQSRELVLGAARRHRLISHPGDMRPTPDEATVRAAREWLAEATETR
ncbi:hypothetical protein ACQBAR_17250 [Propionibacteriaceae bacterium Y1685]